MARLKKGELPQELARAAARFAQWRRGRAPGERIPDPLWNLATALAARYGVSRTATALQVDYYSLKKRSGEEPAAPTQQGEDSALSASFIELPPSALTAASECVIEFENASGDKLRAHFKGFCLPDLAALGRGFWEAR
jgi:hypothetical protein